MKVRICPKCGGQNLETAWYCANPACGATLAVSDIVEMDDRSVHLISPGSGESGGGQVQTPPPSVTPQPVQSSNPNLSGDRKSPALKITLGCLGALLAVSCILALIIGSNAARNGNNFGDAINSVIAAFAAIFGGSLGIILAFGCPLVPLIFWIWTLVDCVQNEPSSGNDKIVWLLVILFTNFIGALLYFFIRRPERKNRFGR